MEKYIKCRETKAASQTQRILFRNKKNGWKTYSIQFDFINCTKYARILSEDLYMRSFLRNLSLRPSCYNCKFKTEHRQADITLADFWGIEHIAPEMDDNMGTSLVVLNTHKGKHIFSNIKPKMNVKEVNFEDAVKYNCAVTESATRPKERDTFINDAIDYGFAYAGKKYLSDSPIIQIKKKLKSVIQKLGRR